MFDLADKFWNWKYKKELILAEKRKAAEEYRAKYAKWGKWIDKAKKEPHQGYSVCLRIQQEFIDCIESGVVSAKDDGYRCHASFANGHSVCFWSANKYYAYAKDARFKDSNGIEYLSGNHVMPELWVCHYIDEMLKAEKVKEHSLSNF